MTRTFLRLSLPLILLFAATLILIRAQPHDDHELRALLLPPACPLPCIMGVRPGNMPMDEGERVLNAHPWIRRLVPLPDVGCLTWEWNGDEPAYVDFAPAFRLVCHNGNDRQIASVRMMINGLSYSEILLLYGKPSRMAVTMMSQGHEQIVTYLDYVEQGVRLRVFFECPMNIQRVWQGAVDEVFVASSPVIPYAQPYSLNRLLHVDGCS
jgi:hypothetical protein